MHAIRERGGTFEAPGEFITRNRFVNSQTFRAAFFLLWVAAVAPPARAVTYTATLLHPTAYSFSMAVGASGASQVGSGYGTTTGENPHALLWNGTAASAVDLQPTGFTSTKAFGVSGASQVGSGYGPATSGNVHALLWSGTAASKVDLNPAGYNVSYALGVSGSSQVGKGLNGDNFHAFLWSGSAASAVDLHPAGFTESFANGVSGSSQVGDAYGPSTAFYDHAMLWSGTALSALDLNPAGFTVSTAYGVAGASQVGSGSGPSTGDITHALMWSGTAASAVDLNPAGFTSSQALGVSTAGQVGNGYGPSTGGNYHALVWNGSAATAIDLHALVSGFVPAIVASSAESISENGTIVGYARDANRNNYAVLWTPIPDSGVAGDYNNNGVVDAGDYVTWRKGTSRLYNEVATYGSISPEDYTEWRARFGNPPNHSIAQGLAAIPEPSTATLLLLCIAWSAVRQRPR